MIKDMLPNETKLGRFPPPGFPGKPLREYVGTLGAGSRLWVLDQGPRSSVGGLDPAQRASTYPQSGFLRGSGGQDSFPSQLLKSTVITCSRSSR